MIQSLLELEVASGLHKRDHPVAMPTLPHHLLRSEWMEAVRAVAFRSILVVGRIGSILLKRHSQNGVGGEEGGTTGTCVRLCPIRDSGGGGPGQSLRKAATGKRGHANIEQLWASWGAERPYLGYCGLWLGHAAGLYVGLMCCNAGS